MIKTILSLTILILLLNLFGCVETININEDQPPAGNYLYQGFDSTGVLITEGKLQINYSDSVTLNGNWQLHAVGNPINIGPQIGEGKLTGVYRDGKTFIALNPDYVDNNVGLYGEYKDGYFSGNWDYSGFPGLINQGKFTAQLE